MSDLGIIDRFLAVFIAYIESGFGLLDGEVAYLTASLIIIDITLAGLFWALGQDSDIIAQLIRKTLYVGFFALLLNNWSLLTTIVFESFAGLGLQASASGLDADDLFRPGFVAWTGFQAALPLLEQAGSLIGFTSFFDNIVTVLVLLLAWFVVVLGFFLLAVQLFITVLEFKLTSLAGFVLVPFALWGRTAFLAERVLGNVIGAGVKMMVLAVILGIGTTLFGDFSTALSAGEADLVQAMSLMLGALALFGLGIFGPAVAAGLTAGAPQLGAGAALGSVGAAVAASLAAAGLGTQLARRTTNAGMTATRAAAALGAGTAAAYAAGRDGAKASGDGTDPGSAVRAGLKGIAQTAGRVMTQGLRDNIAAGMQAGRRAAQRAPSPGSMPAAGGSSAMPAWAARLQEEQRRRGRLLLASQTIRDGDRPASPASPDLSEGDGRGRR